jgi:hypothetical protein
VVCEDFLGVDHHDFAFDLAITGLFNLSCWISRLSVLAPSLLPAFWKSRVQLELQIEVTFIASRAKVVFQPLLNGF